MVQAFCKLIIRRPQLKTFDQVPDNLKPLVHAELFKLGYDDNGVKIPTE